MSVSGLGSPGRLLLSFTRFTGFASFRPRPEAPAPSISSSPLPTPAVELQSAKISKEPEPRERSDAKESSAVLASAPMSPTKRRVLNHYLTLRSSGWVPDGRGRWIKDENVEFDSDEEEPPDLPLD